jgi:hypothetical protein
LRSSPKTTIEGEVMDTQKAVKLILPGGLHSRFRKASQEINRTMSGMARELCRQFTEESEERRQEKERRERSR